jgi:hypothetical protein
VLRRPFVASKYTSFVGSGQSLRALIYLDLLLRGEPATVGDSMCVKTMRKNEMIQGKWARYKVFPMEACLGER